MNITNYHFLKIPACESSNALGILQQACFSNEIKLSSLSCQDFLLNKDKYGLQQMGLMLTCPINRLINAYEQMYQEGEVKPSFKDFYNNPNRINFYSKLFQNVRLEAIGFIAIDTSPFKSLLLAESWLDISLGRISYGAFREIKSPVVSDDDLAIIQMLYAEDIALFEHAKLIFESRWQKLVTNHKNITSTEKKVVIHIGPPKTGTSAIQYSLKQHSTELNAHGVWYPEHQIDGNNISSGNVESLITHKNAEPSSFYDHAKANKLTETFEQSEFDLLLLSSEHFFYYLPWLFAFYPEAQFIFYVRNPLSALESGFHQEVKRHKRTRAFEIPSRLSFQQLSILATISQEFSPDLTISYFDNKLFKSGSLIADFLDLLPKKLALTPNDQRVNTQYCLEAIELMRYCNHFASEPLLSRLDKFFQNYSQTRPLFSYINKDDVLAFEKNLKQQVEELKNKLPQIDVEKMFKIIDNFAPQKPMAIDKQEVSFTHMINKMKLNDLTLAAELLDAIKTNEFDIEASLINSLSLTLREKVLLNAKKLALKIRSVFNRPS